MNLDQNYDKSGNYPLRLQVYLAHSGIASRRASEDLIAEGRVSVNGSIITKPGEKVYNNDIVCFDGKTVKMENVFLYYVLNKPPMYICSSKDPQGRALALDLLPPIKERLYNVGRLDYRSSGLVIFTNDGKFASKISHPSAEIEKEYIVESTVPVSDLVIEDFLKGINIDNVLYRAKKIERLDKNILRIILIEGKNREIRRVFSYFRLHPKSLKRVRIGKVLIGSLKEGTYRKLTDKEINGFGSELW